MLANEDELATLEPEIIAGELPNLKSFQTKFDVDTTAASTAQVPNEEDGALPEAISSFVTYFFKSIQEQRVAEINALYEVSYNKLTEKFYKSNLWPAAEKIAPLVKNDELFITLYNELYYRHIYAKMSPTVQQRAESYKNYCKLFDLILGEKALPLVLPNQWLWDMVDEFIYQFQSFHQFRPKLKSKSDEEISFLKQNVNMWDFQVVLGYLQQFVKKSNVLQVIEKEGEAALLPPKQSTPTPTAPVPSTSTSTASSSSSAPLQLLPDATYVRRMLGYYSIIGLVRLHCLLGDYHTAVRILQYIQPGNKKGLYARITACHTTVAYYLGFCYLMMRRYVDAIRTFTGILIYIMRTKQYHTRSYQYDQIVKKNEQMYALLALCLALCPQRIDESIRISLHEKFLDKLARMQRGDETAAEEMFGYACPKFISPVPPNYSDPDQNVAQEAYKLQARGFMREVRQQLTLPGLRGFLRLYREVPVPKLARFMEVDPDKFRQWVFLLKAKAHQRVSDLASDPCLLAGPSTNCCDIDFFVARETVVVAEPQSSTDYHDYFLRHIHKFDEVIESVESLRAPAANR